MKNHKDPASENPVSSADPHPGSAPKQNSSFKDQSLAFEVPLLSPSSVPNPQPASASAPTSNSELPASPAPAPRARNGKIAHLPRAIRDQLNQRLDDGHEAKALAQWLNSLPEVQSLLARRFDRQPISEMNLTRWKQGGFLDWLSLRQKRLWLAQLAEEADDLNSVATAAPLAEMIASLLAADLALAARDLIQNSADPRDRWQRLREILPELSRLRHDEHRSQLLQQRSKLLELAARRSDRLEADAQARDADACERRRLLADSQKKLISDLFATSDPSLQAIAAELSESLFPSPPSPLAPPPA